jgi:T5orf172 domain-containing protein
MAERETEKEGFVYFILNHDGAYMKIGYSSDAPRRFGEVGLLLPGLRLIGYIPGSKKTESWLHGKFQAHRERGEWFRHTEDLRAFITNLGPIEPAEPAPPKPPKAAKPPKPPKAAKPPKPAEETPEEEVREYLAAKEKNPAAVALGRRGGKKKVPKGVAMLPKNERRERAKKAAAARWKKAGETKKGKA